MFRITARTVLELGSELISSDIIAFYELIKNGFDARTKTGVEVRFDIPLSRSAYRRVVEKVSAGGDLTSLRAIVLSAIDLTASATACNGFRSVVESVESGSELLDSLAEAQARFNTITVSDTGTGMSLDDLEQSFLVIGTPSRKREVEAALSRGDRDVPYLGEKGIGRLSAMRLGEGLRVETARDTDSQLNVLQIDWRDFANVDAMLDQIPVSPSLGAPKPNPTWSGTSIIVSNLVENWTEARVREMAEYDFARLTDPFVDAGARPRIAIFWNGERKAIPIMPSALLAAAHARVEGRYDIVDGVPALTCTVEAIDLGFDHPKERETIRLSQEDLEGALIGRDRHIDDSALKTVGPFCFEAHWYNRRRLSRVDAIGEQRAVRELQEKWSGIMLFRDRFRVFPYGEDEDDWLELDRKALRRSGYSLNKTQFVGRVSISRTANPMLVDQTNREGLRITPEQQVFLEVIRYAVQDQLGAFMRDVEKQYKNQKVDLSDAQAQVTRLQDRAKTAISRLKRLTPPEGDATIEDLQQTLFEFSEFAARARQRIAEVEQESRQLLEMAGVGLMVEVVAHELARASENALQALDRMRGKEIPEGLRAHFKTLQAEMKSVSKRVRILDPLSVSGRQRAEAFALDELIRDTIEAHEAQFARHGILVVLDLPERPIRVKVVKGMIVQILENLISNSVYWLDMRAEREQSFRPEIRITLESGPPTITFEDNGRGIAPENRDKVFKVFFSLKDTRRRRGLGLFIAREAAQHNNGTLSRRYHQPRNRSSPPLYSRASSRNPAVTLTELLAQRGIRTALIVDDFFDAVPTASDIDPGNEAWTNFNDDLTAEQRRLIDEAYPVAQGARFDECVADDKYVAAIWHLRHELGEIATPLFEIYAADQAADERYVSLVRDKLEALNLTVSTAGRNFAEAAREIDLVVIDLFFGKAQGAASLDESKNRLREALQHRRADPPLVVLMSRSPRLEAKRDEFRDEVGLLDSGFRILKKEDLERTVRLELQLERLAENRVDSRALGLLFHELEVGMREATKRTVGLLRKLRLSDVGQIQQLLLNAEGQPVGSYLVDVFDRVLQHEIEREVGIIDAAVALNGFSAAKHPPPYVAGSADLQELVQRLLTQSENRLRLPGSVGARVAFGDLLRISPGTDAARVQRAILVDLTSDNVVLVLTPACDLQRGSAPRILLLVGTIKPLLAKDWSYSDDARTPAVRIDGEMCWVKWNLKHIDTVSRDQLSGALDAGDMRVVGRLREGHALELQQRVLAGLGRVGQMAALPATFPVEFAAFYPNADGRLTSLEVEAFSEGAVCFVGRDDGGTQAVRLVMTETSCDGLIAALDSLEENQIAPRALAAFRRVRSSTDLRRLMTIGERPV